MEKYAFERVEIFLRVKGRLPTEEGDGLTQDILDGFCDKFRKDELKQGMVNLGYLYNLIQLGVIKVFNEENKNVAGPS